MIIFDAFLQSNAALRWRLLHGWEIQYVYMDQRWWLLSVNIQEYYIKDLFYTKEHRHIKKSKIYIFFTVKCWSKDYEVGGIVKKV